MARAGAVDGLIPGEPVDSSYPDDAEHWVTVYSELTEYKRSLLATSADQNARMSPEAVEETGTVDEVLLRQQLNRYKRRLTFWTRRLKELRSEAETFGAGNASPDR